MSIHVLDSFQAIVDDAFRGPPLDMRQDKAAAFLFKAYKHLSKKDFKELENHIFEKLR